MVLAVIYPSLALTIAGAGEAPPRAQHPRHHARLRQFMMSQIPNPVLTLPYVLTHSVKLRDFVGLVSG